MTRGLTLEHIRNPHLRAQAAAKLAGKGAPREAPQVAPASPAKTVRPAAPNKRRGVMNRTEQRYAAHLEQLLALGEIRGWQYEAQTLCWYLPDGTRQSYTPDFLVMPATGDRYEFHEVKARWSNGAVGWGDRDGQAKRQRFIAARAHHKAFYRLRAFAFCPHDGWKEVTP